jgi:hypothetical protein
MVLRRLSLEGVQDFRNCFTNFTPVIIKYYITLITVKMKAIQYASFKA